jgi:hypothetical protein
MQGAEVRVVDDLRQVPAAAWDALLAGEPEASGAGSPFLEWRWLQALEEAGCVRPQDGWQPLHLLVYQGERLVAAAPAYLKGQSEGEFVFDWSWAELAERLGVAYYPKLILAVPFTPATGPRLLTHPDLPEAERAALRRLLASAAATLCEQLGASSLHVLFPPEEQAAALAGQGLLRRIGVQFHFRNRGYRDFDDFLSTFSAKRRHMIRRERREVERAGVVVETRRAPFSAEEVAAMYQLYVRTVDKFVWGRRYLNERFFALVAERMPERLELVIARHKDGGPILAGAINLVKGRRLYGRYWGQLAEPEIRYLHFEVCYYHSIEACIARGIEVFEPGAGGEHKLARGFLPAITHSAHHIRDRRLRGPIASFLRREEAALRAQIAQAQGEGGDEGEGCA